MKLSFLHNTLKASVAMAIVCGVRGVFFAVLNFFKKDNGGWPLLCSYFDYCELWSHYKVQGNELVEEEVEKLLSYDTKKPRLFG